MMIMRFFSSDFLYKGICCGYSFELHRQVDAIQISTYNICLYKEVDKKYTGCNLKTTELLDCALIGICAVIRSNTVYKIIGAHYAYIILTPLTPLLYSKTGVYKGINSFSYFCSKHRLWVLVRTASPRRF